MPKKAPAATNEYAVKATQEISRLARRRTRAGLEPFGDPLSGVVLVAELPEPPRTARTVDALRRSLAAVGLDAAYVTWLPVTLEEILALEPAVLAAVGPAAARSIDSLGYPLAKTGFSETPEGSWFAWTEGTSGLKLPALAPALDDPAAKRDFWRAFLALRGPAGRARP